MKSLCKSLFKNKCYFLSSSFKAPCFQLKDYKLYLRHYCLKHFSLTNGFKNSNPINSKSSNRNRSEYNNDTIEEFLERIRKRESENLTITLTNGDKFKGNFPYQIVDITKANGVKLKGRFERIPRDMNRQNPEFIGPFLPKMCSTKKYTLVLDLDNTLIYCKNPDEEEIKVNLRPHLDTFLDKMSKLFEIVIFTSATKKYANDVLDKIDKGRISHRLYREHTTICRQYYFKDLSLLGRDLKRVILIDDLSSNFVMQPNNGVEVSFYNNKNEDEELLKLCSELERIVALDPDDIRLHIDEIRETVGHILIFHEESDEHYRLRMNT